MKHNLTIGTKVRRVMGCSRNGEVIAAISLNECTDGTYRGAIGREKFICVRWTDGTQGYENIVWLEVIR